MAGEPREVPALLPCPFCGGPARRDPNEAGDIWCKACEFCVSTDDDSAGVPADARWNRRCPVPPVSTVEEPATDALPPVGSRVRMRFHGELRGFEGQVIASSFDDMVEVGNGLFTADDMAACGGQYTWELLSPVPESETIPESPGSASDGTPAAVAAEPPRETAPVPAGAQSARLERFMGCERSGEWPGYVQSIIDLDVPDEVELDFGEAA